MFWLRPEMFPVSERTLVDPELCSWGVESEHQNLPMALQHLREQVLTCP